jgi:2'-5' RNA ligase
MRSVELTFGESTDSSIRTDWATLSEAGLPSLASHTSPSNRPHITLAAGNLLDVGPDIQNLWSGLPFSIRFSGLVVFPAGAGKYVLARLVVPAPDLLQLHARLHQRCTGAYENTLPNAWTPHVTLARRIPGHRLGAALDALAARTEGQCVEARLWDSSTRTITSLGGRPAD